MRKVYWLLLRQGLSVPLLLKGIMTPEEADAAVKHGVQGILVSNHGGILTKRDGYLKRCIAIDCGCRRGDGFRSWSMVVFGGTPAFSRRSHSARVQVILGRPALWGLVAYGAEGVQSVVEMLQTEVGRDFGHCGTPTITSISPAHIKIHLA